MSRYKSMPIYNLMPSSDVSGAFKEDRAEEAKMYVPCENCYNFEQLCDFLANRFVKAKKYTGTNENHLPPQLYNAAGRSAAYSIAEAICQSTWLCYGNESNGFSRSYFTIELTESSTAVSPRKVKSDQCSRSRT